MTPYFNEIEVAQIGLRKFGQNVQISRKCSIYNPQKISLGSNVRIDDFCILTNNISIGNNVHISAFSALFGGGQIIISDYCGLSPRCTLLSASDDFSGQYMIGPMVQEKYTNVKYGVISLKKYTQLGTQTVVLPNVTANEGAVTGASTLVIHNLEPWTINIGIPSRIVTYRQKNMLESVKLIETKE